MPSSGPFVFFDHEFTIEADTVTRATVNQNTGQATAPSTSTQTIDGNVTRRLDAQQRQMDGLEYRGDAVLYTEADLDFPDNKVVVRVWNSDKASNPNDFTEYKVIDKWRHETIAKHTGILRIAYSLERMHPGDN